MRAIVSSVLLLSLVAASIGAEWHTAVYQKSDGSLKVVPGKKHELGDAWATFENTMSKDGWTYFTVESNSRVSDGRQAYAAGYLEGWLAMSEIHDTYLNFNTWIDPKVKEFPNQNFEWIRQQLLQSKDRYWEQVDLVILQFQGLLDGYNDKAPSDWKLSEYQFNLLQLNTELGDINSTARFKPKPEGELSCSSLIRLTPNREEILSTHATWSSFSLMLRMWKNIKLHFKSGGTKAKAVSFSGYPGIISSGDDFYLTDQGMTIIETTNDVFNKSLFAEVTPHTVPYWIRVTVAAKMANSCKEWNAIFSKYNSGTYNNQWIVLDNKKFTPGQPLPPDTFWITEQIPGYLYGGDQSHHLNTHGFWASYNVPFYPFIYNISGYPEHVAKNGNGSSYEWCPRAQIFRRDAHDVKDLEGMKRIIRYNDYQDDVYSNGDSCASIAARCDLNVQNCAVEWVDTDPFGAIDAKITSTKWAKSMSAEIVSGPTWDAQPPFAWTKRYTSFPSNGLPKTFNFDWVKVHPTY